MHGCRGELKLKASFFNNGRRERFKGFLFFLPWLIGFLGLTLYPIIYSIRISLSEVRLVPGKTELKFTGLDFYSYAWNTDTQFRGNIASAVIFICCSVPVIIVFALIIAVFLNSKFIGRTFLRAVYFLPVIIMSGPAISKLLTGYTVDFSSNNPEIFTFINALPSFISTPAAFILNNLVLILWFSGVEIIIFLAGLQKISPSLYEAAAIDGAGRWEQFWEITLPHIAPLAVICAVYAVVDISNYSNLDINSKITSHMFDTSRIYSFSAAMSWIYFAVLMLILLAVFLLFFFIGKKSAR